MTGRILAEYHLRIQCPWAQEPPSARSSSFLFSGLALPLVPTSDVPWPPVAPSGLKVSSRSPQAHFPLSFHQISLPIFKFSPYNLTPASSTFCADGATTTALCLIFTSGYLCLEGSVEYVRRESDDFLWVFVKGHTFISIPGNGRATKIIASISKITRLIPPIKNVPSQHKTL